MGKLVVIYGGGFQPFHEGHLSSYLEAKKAFPNSDFYVAASADVKQRPIPFKEKRFLATQAGVDPKDFRDIAVKSPLNPQEILSHYDPEQDVFVLVRSERDPVPYTKKDGSPGYYQPYIQGEKLQPFSKHGYVFVTKKHDFSLLGQEVYSGTQVRNLYTQANDKQRLAMIKEMYPRSKQLGTIKKILDSYLLGATVMKEQILKFIKESRPLLKEADAEQKVKLLKLVKEGISFLKTKQKPEPEKKPEEDPGLGYEHFFKPKDPVKPEPKHYHGWEEYNKEKVKEFAPPQGRDDNEDDILFKYARLWFNAESDEQKQVKIENVLAKMGWEIGYDEGYDDEWGVFVVRAGDTNGDSYISWSPEDLRGFSESKENPDYLEEK